MQKHHRLALDTVRKLAPEGASCTLQPGRKHPHILVEMGPRSFKLTVASTPRSDSKCQENYIRQQLRRAIGEAQ